MKLAVGRIFDLAAAREHGLPVGLGTDGAGSNNSLDLLADAKHFALGQKHLAVDAAAEPGRRDAGDRDAARGRRCSARRRSRSGAPADLLLVRTDGHELGVGALDAGLVYAASGVGRRHDDRRRPGADARRRRRRRGRDPRACPRARAADSGWSADVAAGARPRSGPAAASSSATAAAGSRSPSSTVRATTTGRCRRASSSRGRASRTGALREVEEETGFRCELGDELSPISYHDRKGRLKLVRYWVMSVARRRVRAERRGRRPRVAAARRRRPRGSTTSTTASCSPSCRAPASG